eukprot:Unigene1763_Nuclearia_a/m.5467 Unigene1763_Nuclearia_a/g.5467  ORF Unigene1763_Nuclearia_a/g.5467 Unigene1763_Nuclearia_a/m.5467 type:complete len:374 (+) Unigene1763_Nuclearia_a:163-1284(+)
MYARSQVSAHVRKVLHGLACRALVPCPPKVHQEALLVLARGARRWEVWLAQHTLHERSCRRRIELVQAEQPHRQRRHKGPWLTAADGPQRLAHQTFPVPLQQRAAVIGTDTTKELGQKAHERRHGRLILALQQLRRDLERRADNALDPRHQRTVGRLGELAAQAKVARRQAWQPRELVCRVRQHRLCQLLHHRRRLLALRRPKQLHHDGSGVEEAGVLRRRKHRRHQHRQRHQQRRRDLPTERPEHALKQTAEALDHGAVNRPHAHQPLEVAPRRLHEVQQRVAGHRALRVVVVQRHALEDLAQDRAGVHNVGAQQPQRARVGRRQRLARAHERRRLVRQRMQGRERRAHERLQVPRQVVGRHGRQHARDHAR